MNNYEYDVALSFAGENREYVKKVAKHLNNAGIKVFFDEFEQEHLWGKNLYDYLQEVYTKKAQYTMMFISKFYKNKAWTNHERESAQARAFNESKEYILPIKFDNTEIPGMHSTIGYLDANNFSAKEIAEFFLAKNRNNSSTPTIIDETKIINNQQSQKLSKDIILLKEASLDPNGSIHLIESINGLILESNKKNLIQSNHRREIAQWEEALDSLVYNGLLKQTNRGRGVTLYEITNSGYDTVDNT